MKISREKKILTAIIVILITGGIFALYEYKNFMTVPKTRLAAGSYYTEMPIDNHHIYIQLPIDHTNPSLGTFTAFYLLSPNFKIGDNVIFQFYDNQQEKVGMIKNNSDFEIFDDLYGKDKSYVLIGNRGVPPTLFPEVFDKSGKPDLALAIKLYGSDQQIEDIELVRQDMVKRGLLPKDGKIIVTGGSGGGFLVQQYLNKYGKHVSRALIESTGAPDIAKDNNLTFARNFCSSNPEAAKIYYELYKKGKASSSLSWVLFKIGLDGNTQLQTDILKGKKNAFDISAKFLYMKNWFKIPQNFAFINLMFKSPSILEVKVRVWELLGADLVNYKPASAEEINLMYQPIKEFLGDFLDAYKDGKISTLKFDLDRSKYEGEIMIWANDGDQDFGAQIANLIGNAYPHSKTIVFKENAHRITERTDYYKSFAGEFFKAGLSSTEIKKYYNNPKVKK